MSQRVAGPVRTQRRDVPRLLLLHPVQSRRVHLLRVHRLGEVAPVHLGQHRPVQALLGSAPVNAHRVIRLHQAARGPISLRVAPL